MSIKTITTLEQLKSLDNSKIVAGYFAGFKSTPNYTEQDGAYWHGYMNGQVDGNHMPISDEQRELARVYVASQKAN